MIKTEKPLVQWDLNRVVEINTTETFNEVHFYNSNCPEAMAVEPFDDNTKANIPNILLQEALPIVVWLVYSDESGDRSLDCDTLVISPRKMPPGYVYEETEVITFKKLTKDVEEAIKRANDISADMEEKLTKDVEEAVKRANDISADMEEKRDSGYFNGRDGKSAYEHAVDGGYIGSEESFAESLAHVAELEAYKANSIISKTSGVALAITDSAKIKPQSIKTYGKSEQVQYKGNQLFDGILVKGGIEPTTGADNTAQDRFRSGFIKVVPNETYIWTEYIAAPKSIFTRLYDENKTFLPGTTITIVSGKSFVMPSGVHYMRVMYTDTSYVDLQTLDYQAMLNKGTSALPWEPYVGGVASPSIEYSQEVESCGENGRIKNWLTSNNLFAGNIVGGYLSNTDGSISNRTENIKDVVCIENYIPLLQNTLTTVIRDFNSNEQYSFAYRVGFYDKDKKWIYNTFVKAETQTLQAPANAKYVRVSAGGIDRMAVYFGDIPYAKYESSTAQELTFQTPNSLRGIPLGSSIPDAIKNSPIHMSGIYWDSEESQYYIADTKNESGKDVQRIARKFVTEINSYDTTNKFGDVWHLGGLAENNKRMPILSNHFRFAENLKEDGIGFWYSAILRLYYDAGSKEAFNEWLAQNEVYVDYILAEPIITDTSEEELAQYNALVMNYPNTTIINDANAHMDVEYVVDTKSYVDQKIASAIADMQALILEN